MIRGLVSVITPCFNGAAYIGETIESVLSQDYTDWEMIVVDDGSTDGSADVVRGYMEKDPRLRLIRQENRGSAAARNCGIRAAEGQYIALLDADDLWDRNFLSGQLRFMKEKDASCVCCSYRMINRESKETGRPVTAKEKITVRDMRRRNYIGCLTGLYDTAGHGKVYLHEELGSMRDDYAYWIDVVELAGAVYGNPDILAGYRVSPGSTTGKKAGLVGKQYHFYRTYLRQGVLSSASHTVRWSLAGLSKWIFRTENRGKREKDSHRSRCYL